MGLPFRAAKTEKIICYCNEVSQPSIEEAIKNGCTNLGSIFDATRAGVGPCGGSCQGRLLEMLKCYHQTGEFPQFEARKRKRR